MMLESKLKQVALIIAVDINLKSMKKSPDRCARNLMELGIAAYPDVLSQGERNDFYRILLDVCKSGDNQCARDLFLNTFSQTQG